jgi:hypothetical protein
MIPGTQPKLELLLESPGDYNWKLVRKRDGLAKQSRDIKWIEWNEDGTGKDSHNSPKIGLSLVMSPFNNMYTWLTTNITEIVKDTPEYIHFKTTNSEYELFKLK